VTDRSLYRRQALHAAASVALAFSAGCAGGKTTVPTPQADPSGPGSVAAETPAPATATLEARISAIRAPFQEICGPKGEGRACCDALRDACSEDFDEQSVELGQCLYGPGTDGSHGCTPWGPPVPPAMA
jgi:hypothetical protein